MKNALIALALIILIGGGIYLSQKEKAVPSGKTIKIGAVVSLTSFGASWGEHTKRGAELAVQEINAEGGVLESPLELVIEDDRSEAKTAVSALYKILSTGDVHFVLTTWSAFTTPLIPILDKESVIGVTVSAGAPDITKQSSNKNLFRTWSSDKYAVDEIIKLAEKKGWKRIAVARSIAEWEDSLRTTFITEAPKHGIEVVADVGFQYTQTDMKADILKIKNAQPDAVFIPITYAPAVIFIDQAVTLGVEVPLLFPNDFNVPDTVENLGADQLAHVIYTTTPPATAAFAEAYEKEFGVKPGPSADTSYDAVYMIADAIQKAGTTDPEQVKQSFTRRDGASGVIEFDEFGDRKPGKYLFFTFDNKEAVTYK